AIIAAAGEAAPHPSPLPQGEGSKKAAAKSATPSRKTTHPLPSGEGKDEGRVLASPAARRIAKENNVDLAVLKGSGPDGSVVAEDVLRAGGAVKESATGGPPRVKQAVPHFYVGIDVDMSAVEKRRGELKQKGAAPSINDFILSAVAKTLRDFP